MLQPKLPKSTKPKKQPVAVKSEQVAETNVEPDPKVTAKKAVASSSRKHSVTSSDSDVVRNKSRHLESAQSGKGKGKGNKTVSKNNDGNKQDQALENVKVQETSSNESTNKEIVVTVRTGRSRKHKTPSQGILMQKSSSTPHVSDLSDGGETDATLEGEEERFGNSTNQNLVLVKVKLLVVVPVLNRIQSFSSIRKKVVQVGLIQTNLKQNKLSIQRRL